MAADHLRPTTGKGFGFRPTGRISPFFDGVTAAGGRNYFRHFNSYIAYDYDIGIEDQYRVLRDAVTLVDVSVLRVIEIKGPDALRFADFLSTRNLAAMEPGRSTYTFLCDESGTVVADPVVLILDAETVWFVISLVDLLLWIKGVAVGLGFAATVVEIDGPPVQIQGPCAAEVLEQVTDRPLAGMPPFRNARARVAGFECVISTTGYSGEQSFEIYLLGAAPYPAGRDRANAFWNAILDAGKPSGIQVSPVVFDRALEAGFTTLNHGQGEAICALEHWRPGIVDFGGGDFIGRAALEAIRDTGGPPRRMVGLATVEDGKRITRGEWDMPVLAAGTPVGCSRRSGYSRALGRGIAIGLIDAAHAGHGTNLVLRHAGGDTNVQVMALPLVRS